jgi:hypothetical protein
MRHEANGGITYETDPDFLKHLQDRGISSE